MISDGYIHRSSSKFRLGTIAHSCHAPTGLALQDVIIRKSDRLRNLRELGCMRQLVIEIRGGN